MFRVTLAVALFPALSMALPVITCPAPDVFTLTGEGQVLIPDNASEHVKVTVTGTVLFQPFPFGRGETAALIIGTVLSIFKTTEALAVAPDASVAIAVIV